MPNRIRAAGGIVWRDGDGGPDVLVVHRLRYDDWSFPKGKLDPGESWEQAAVREVWEETGVVPVLGAALDETAYTDHKGRRKTVRYWAMTVAADTGFEPDDEISGRRWCSVREAHELLTYDRDRDLLDRLVDALAV